MKYSKLAAVALIVALPAICQAITLAPGQSGSPTLLARNPNAVVLNASPSGDPLLASSMHDYPNIGPAFASQPRAEQNTATLSTDFIFRVYFFSPLLPQATTISLPGYRGFTVDAGYTLFASAAIVPTSVSRSADGDVITYDFTGVDVVGRTTELLIRTNAPNYSVNHASISFADGALTGGTYSVETLAYAPAAGPVPELSTLSLLTLATAGLALRYRRRP